VGEKDMHVQMHAFTFLSRSFNLLLLVSNRAGRTLPAVLDGRDIWMTRKILFSILENDQVLLLRLYHRLEPPSLHFIFQVDAQLTPHTTYSHPLGQSLLEMTVNCAVS
jgi:hypothetical protein